MVFRTVLYNKDMAVWNAQMNERERLDRIPRVLAFIGNYYIPISFILTSSNRGKGDYYRLGHGTDEHVRIPKKVSALHDKKIVCVATGSLHCVACTDTGEVYTWGDNDEGQLGDASTNAVQRPRLVTALQVSFTSHYTLEDIIVLLQ